MSTQQKIEWIKATDRLPEPGQLVLTWYPKGWRQHKLGLHTYERNFPGTGCDWWIGSQNHMVHDGSVTHWARITHLRPGNYDD